MKTFLEARKLAICYMLFLLGFQKGVPQCLRPPSTPKTSAMTGLARQVTDAIVGEHRGSNQPTV